MNTTSYLQTFRTLVFGFLLIGIQVSYGQKIPNIGFDPGLLSTEYYSLPTIDLDRESEMQVVVDREPGQYLGHPTTHLLQDGKTIICTYPKGHGRGAIVMKRSKDGGKTWGDRLSGTCKLGDIAGGTYPFSSYRCLRPRTNPTLLRPLSSQNGLFRG